MHFFCKAQPDADTFIYRPKRNPTLVLGFFIVVLSSVFFCIQNVTVRVLFNEHVVLGLWQTGGFVPPTLQNSFLLMFMRMVLVVPLMSVLNTRLHPTTWQEVRSLRDRNRWPVLGRSLLGGVLMFLYLALLYIAIGLIPTGIAITLFFTFPIFTALFSWQWFGDRPSLLRWGIMGLILIGSILLLPRGNETATLNWAGVLTGLGSAIAYGTYTVVGQKSMEQFHPVPFTWISFTVTLVLCGLCVLLWPGTPIEGAWTALWIGGLLSALSTFAGHVLFNSGIHLIGATTAAMIGASNPALTALLAGVAIQEQLESVQLVGVGIVTLSVVLLGRERR